MAGSGVGHVQRREVLLLGRGGRDERRQQGDQLDVGVCAEGVGKRADKQKTVALLAPQKAAPGTQVTLTVRVQDGPILTYTYRALGEKKPPGCKKPTELRAASAGCEKTVKFVFTHGGRPKGAPADIIDMTTNGIGKAGLQRLNQEREAAEAARAGLDHRA